MAMVRASSIAVIGQVRHLRDVPDGWKCAAELNPKQLINGRPCQRKHNGGLVFHTRYKGKRNPWWLSNYCEPCLREAGLIW